MHIALCSPRSISASSLNLFNFSRTRNLTKRRFCFNGARMSEVELDSSLAVKKKAVDVAAELKGTSIFLVGMNCSMKTSLGNLLADALRYYYFDSDDLVEQAAGCEPGGKSFQERDQSGFRESETEVLKQLSSMGRLVVCAGDGSVESSTNLALLRHGISLYVDVPLEVIAKELLKPGVMSTLGAGSDPFSEALEKLMQRYEEMKGGYGTADATVSLQKVATKLSYGDLDSVTPEDMAMEALREIERLTRAKKMLEEAGRPF